MGRWPVQKCRADQHHRHRHPGSGQPRGDDPGLDYDRRYEYRLVHRRGDAALAEYQAFSRTRLAPADTTPFTFVIYGDSAWVQDLAPFRSVQIRINLVNPTFTLLLGDNAYNEGSHPQFDARMDPALNLDLTQYAASHIDYYAMGDHDAVAGRGQPLLTTMRCPCRASA